MNIVENIKKSLEWVQNNSTDDYIYVSSKNNSPYPEVTGYFIPTLRDYGFHDKAKSFASYLAKTQNDQGYWTFSGKPFVFDTAMILDGLCEYKEEYEEEIEKALVWLGSRIKNGKFISDYNKPVPNHIYMRVLWCMHKAGYDISEIKESYINDSTYSFSTLSHFYGYSFEGYARLGEDCAKFMKTINKYGGLVTERPGMHSYCYTGLSQIAVSLSLIGEQDIALKIIQFVTKNQTKAGGFLGSDGEYFADEEISWAVKFYLDSILEYQKSSMLKFLPKFKNEFEGGDLDSRFRFISDRVTSTDIVLDVGCGKGRYINNIECQERHASDLVDSSEYVDCEFEIGSCLNLPYDDNTFDKVVCAEVLEHSVFHENAIDEMLRITKQDGKILIVDKVGEVPKKSFMTESYMDVDRLSEVYDVESQKLDGDWDFDFYGVSITK